MVGLLITISVGSAALANQPVHGGEPNALYRDTNGFVLYQASPEQHDRALVARADRAALLEGMDAVIKGCTDKILQQRLVVMRKALQDQTLLAVPYQSNGLLLFELPKSRINGNMTYLVTTSRNMLSEKTTSPWLPFSRAGGTCFRPPVLCIEEPTNLSPVVRGIVTAHELRHWLYHSGDEFSDYQLIITLARNLGGPSYQLAVEGEKERIRTSWKSEFVGSPTLGYESLVKAFGCDCPSLTGSDWAFRTTFAYLDAYFQVIQERNTKNPAQAEATKRQFVEWHVLGGITEK
jgi:hypothetical protein